jgi:Uncharacterized protein conserved in bacteria (DUF2252)
MIPAHASVMEATDAYEAWLRRQTRVVAADLQKKHKKMRKDAFVFLRATFYRWLEVWLSSAGPLLDAPTVMAVGDVHLENFGTWRDAEGRLVWGVNDVDDACELPYTQDLVRLATSVELAGPGRLRAACGAILDGYRSSLLKGGRPIVLAERHAWLRGIAMAQLEDPQQFWTDLQASLGRRGTPPRELLTGALPEGATGLQFASRTAGVGSLGRQRFAVTALSGGSTVAREAKALAPSALSALTGRKERPRARMELLEEAVRVPDPFQAFEDGWIIRRLAPDCRKIEIDQLARRGDDERFLRAMGWEVANLHLATGKPRAMVRDLDRRPKRWLEEAVVVMAKAVERDFREWKVKG